MYQRQRNLLKKKHCVLKINGALCVCKQNYYFRKITKKKRFEKRKIIIKRQYIIN